MTAPPVQRRRGSLLMVLAVALTLALLPHPQSPTGNSTMDETAAAEDLQQHLGPLRRFLAMAQEPHSQFHWAEGAEGAVEPEVALEDLDERLAEAENASVSLTLLGCMGFVMATFYLVNWPDEDIRQISLEVINSTISVFGSLLLFHTFEELLEHYVLPEMNQWQEVIVSMLQMLLWFALLQMVLGYYAGALGQNKAVRLRSDSLCVAKACGSPRTKACLMKSAERHLGVIKMNTEAWGILLGHATGFAATKACSQLQQAVPRSFFCVALMPFVSFGIIILVYRATEFLRYKVIMRDGQEDEFEELWRERTAETEDEVIALAVSFSFAQTLRFGISGHLPDVLGEDPEGFNLHSDWSCALLLLVGLVPGLADFVRVLSAGTAKKFVRMVSGEGEEEAVRSNNWWEGISSMSFAWCLLFASEWWITSHLNLEGCMKAVLGALAVTAIAFILIFGLDKVADNKFDDVEVVRALRGMIAGLGLLVGFSWERCFDASLEGLSQHRYFGKVPQTINRTALAIGLALLVLPAWKWYILPMLHGLHDHHHPKAQKLEEPAEVAAAPESRRRVFGRLGSSMSLLSDGTSGTSGTSKGKLPRRFSTFSRDGSVSLLTA